MIRKAYVDGRWGQVHVRDTGGRGVPLILLHQSPLSGAMFDPAMPLLAAAGIRAIAVDTAGFGMSDPPPAPASIPEHGNALARVLDALGLEAPAVLGHHTGAMIAASFAAQHPGRVSRLVLNGVPALSAAERAHFADFRFSALQPEADGSHLLAAWNQRLRASPGWTHLDAMHKHVVEMLAKNQTYWWGFTAALSHDMDPDLAAIRCPTLVFTNTGEDLYDSSKRVADAHPGWRFAALEGGTHDIVDEQPDAWAKVVADFVTG